MGDVIGQLPEQLQLLQAVTLGPHRHVPDVLRCRPRWPSLANLHSVVGTTLSCCSSDGIEGNGSAITGGSVSCAQRLA